MKVGKENTPGVIKYYQLDQNTKYELPYYLWYDFDLSILIGK